jgi:isopenicillin N synthase-like dioxygenase
MPTEAGLPVIDLRELRLDEIAAAEVASQIDAAFRDVGFCAIVNTGVPKAARDAAFAASRRFHTLPAAAKQAIAINRFHRGYIAPKTSLIVTSSVAKVSKPNNSESFIVLHEVAPDDPCYGNPLQGPNQWPEGLPGFREAVTGYEAEVRRLAEAFTRLVARALGLRLDWFDPHFRRPTTFLRMLHYPPHPGATAEEFGSAPHTDYGFLTFLLQDGVGGLQVRRRDGSWIEATPIPDAFIINVADLLARWTGGRWQSTPHRVRNHPDVDRYSIPYFWDPSMDTEVTVVPGCGDADAVAPVNYGAYLMERLDRNYTYRGQAG